MLDGLPQELRAGGSGWLAKARQRPTDTLDRFAAMEAEGWQE